MDAFPGGWEVELEGQGLYCQPAFYGVSLGQGSVDLNFEFSIESVVRGKIEDFDGRGFSEALVEIFQNGQLVQRTKTDYQGFYALGCSAGQVQLRVSGQFDGPYQQNINLPEGTTIDLNIIISRYGWAEGKITDTENNLVSGASISSGSASTNSTTSGTYKLFLTAGSHSIEVEAPGFAPASQRVEIVSGRGVTRDFILEKSQGVTITIEIKSSRGEPIPGAFFSVDNNILGSVNSQGLKTINLEPGEHTITYWAKGFFPYWPKPLSSQIKVDANARYFRFSGTEDGLWKLDSFIYGRLVGSDGAKVDLYQIWCFFQPPGRPEEHYVVYSETDSVFRAPVPSFRPIDITFVAVGNNARLYKSYNLQDLQINSGGDSLRLDVVLQRVITSVNAEEVALPQKFSLAQNYPNPFNPTTDIEFETPEAGHVVINIYNTLGQKVTTLADKKMNPGSYTVVFNAANLPAGIYFYEIKTASRREVKKMLLVK